MPLNGPSVRCEFVDLRIKVCQLIAHALLDGGFHGVVHRVHRIKGGLHRLWVEADPISVHLLTASMADCAELCDLSSECMGFMYKFDGTWSDPNPVFHDQTCSLYSELVPTETAVESIHSARMD